MKYLPDILINIRLTQLEDSITCVKELKLGWNFFCKKKTKQAFHFCRKTVSHISSIKSMRMIQEMAHNSNNIVISSNKHKSVDLKLDGVNFEPTSIVTRHEYRRRILYKQFEEDEQSKLTASPFDEANNLQGSKIVTTCEQQTNPLNSTESSDYSVWNENAHPTRHYRRTYEFTKPDNEYFYPSQWR